MHVQNHIKRELTCLWIWWAALLTDTHFMFPCCFKCLFTVHWALLRRKHLLWFPLGSYERK